MSDTKAYTTVLQYGDTADYATSTTWTSVAKVKNIKPPKVTAKDIDVTVLDSPNEFDELLPGLANGGELEATVKYEKTNEATLYGFFRTVKGWRVKYADTSGWEFNGYISEYGDEEIVNGDIVKATLKIKVTGKPIPAATLT